MLDLRERVCVCVCLFVCPKNTDNSMCAFVLMCVAVATLVSAGFVLLLLLLLLMSIVGWRDVEYRKVSVGEKA